LVRRREQEGKLRWQFPGGVVRGDQADKDVAEREAFEETNIKCRAVRKVGQRVHPDTKALVHYWLCQYIEGKEVLRDTKDLAEVRWVTPKNAFELITSDIYPHLKKVLRAEAKVK
jgi:8-oxo-dGTP pyrophosphatase MutT (NUDIX family)